ncbi:MAG: hypothetical protein HZB56_17190 [Deltaproteobacteria bacterium]|nr:hypothetical protein [Deltaproteobacteria bacterium]
MFAVDVLDCPRCHGRLELVAFIAEPGLARRILDHLRLAAQAPPLPPARAADLAEGDAHPDYGTEPVYED